MSDRTTLQQALAPILDVLAEIDPGDPGASEALAARLPVDGPDLAPIRALVVEGLEQGWLTPREADGVRFGRVGKPESTPHGFSIDAVEMRGPGPAHTHPEGELDLCFALDGDPRFDGRTEGWTVYPPGSWHVPTVRGGRMGILYFLPGGSIVFGPRAG